MHVFDYDPHRNAMIAIFSIFLQLFTEKFVNISQKNFKFSLDRGLHKIFENTGLKMALRLTIFFPFQGGCSSC